MDTVLGRGYSTGRKKEIPGIPCWEADTMQEYTVLGLHNVQVIQCWGYRMYR